MNTSVSTEYLSTGNQLGSAGKRLESIDLLRGLVMILMALDHTRDYFHNDAFLFAAEDLSKTNMVLFFTRWITHYCAPVFVFLSGISAYLQRGRKTKKELSAFLFTRGLWLILVELVFVALFRTFNLHFIFNNLQVIWAIGVSMAVLAGLIYLPLKVILGIAVVILAGHNLLDTVHVPGNGAVSFLWSVLHDPKVFTYGDHIIRVAYPVLPWIGVMALGYAVGCLYDHEFSSRRRKILLVQYGLGCMLAFILLRIGNFYGDAHHWQLQNTAAFSFLSFINVTKYPPSLLYTLVTIGPAMIFLGLAEKKMGSFSRKIIVFGRVPMFYYLAHILLIHLLALAGVYIQGHPLTDMVLSTSVLAAPALKGYGFSLPVVYLVWVLVVVMLYPLCKRFGLYKQQHQRRKKWLSYL